MILGVVAFIGAYVFLFPTGCNDVGGVPSWERCRTVLGNPAFSLSDWGLASQFDILIPLAVASLIGALTWWALGSTTTDDT